MNTKLIATSHDIDLNCGPPQFENLLRSNPPNSSAKIRLQIQIMNYNFRLVHLGFLFPRDRKKVQPVGMLRDQWTKMEKASHIKMNHSFSPFNTFLRFKDA